MDWQKFGTKVAEYAPVLGGLVGGVGAPIGALIAAAFGTENEPEAIMNAIQKDPEAVAKLAELETSVIKERSSTLQTMLIANSKSTHTTRPKIAYQAWQVTGIIVLMIAFAFVYAVLVGDTEMLAAITNGWPFLLALIGPLVGWLNAYFGILRKEDNDKINALNGNLKTSLLDKLLKR